MAMTPSCSIIMMVLLSLYIIGMVNGVSVSTCRVTYDTDGDASPSPQIAPRHYMESPTSMNDIDSEWHRNHERLSTIANVLVQQIHDRSKVATWKVVPLSLSTMDISDECHIHLQVTARAPRDICHASLSSFPSSVAWPSESYVICNNGTNSNGKYNSIVIVVASTRGLFPAIGRLLQWIDFRSLIIDDSSLLSLPLSHTSSVAVRGQQLSYRYLSNSYDSWTPARFRSYITDLALFGSNQIEMISPDRDISPYFPLPPSAMAIEISRIVDSLGLRLSIWNPNPIANPSQWRANWRNLTRLDSLFVPGRYPHLFSSSSKLNMIAMYIGGDPGDATPKQLFQAIHDAINDLYHYHPKCEVWISNQVLCSPSASVSTYHSLE
jgi:hypothetical protein